MSILPQEWGSAIRFKERGWANPRTLFAVRAYTGDRPWRIADRPEWMDDDDILERGAADGFQSATWPTCKETR